MSKQDDECTEEEYELTRIILEDKIDVKPAIVKVRELFSCSIGRAARLIHIVRTRTGQKL